jgi:dCTP deaminase
VYLSDVDLRQAVQCGDLIVKPLPDKEIGSTSIDLHLDSVEQAKVWDFEALAKHNKDMGHPPKELHIARMNYATVSRQFMTLPPSEDDAKENDLVFRRGNSIILHPYGFVIWQTKEIAGTPEENPRYICFIDGKSTRSRTGLIVHLTAPTVHAGWNGNLTLEMTNVGPLDLVLFEGDAVAQLTVARLSWPPSLDIKLSATHGQTSVHGAEPNTSSA